MDNKDKNTLLEAEAAEKEAGSAIFPEARRKMLRIPVFLLVPIAYVVLGMAFHWWHPTWIMFLFIPMYYQLCAAVGAKTKKGFLLNLPVVFVILAAYLTLGFMLSLWHPLWIMFLFIPVYYWCVAFMKK